MEAVHGGRHFRTSLMGISVVMVGTGAFAQGFIPLFQAHPLVERIALCDLDAEKLERNKARHGIAESFASLDEVCASDFDAAVIITQQWLHGPQAVQALRAGKHVWSAVPAGYTVEECRALVRAVQESGCIYMMAETSYYYPAVIYCRQRHAEGAFGRIVFSACEYYHDWDHGLYAVARWRGGERWRWTAGAPPMYYPTHSTSQIISVTGAHMTRVSCQGFVDRHRDGVYQAANNAHGNTFSNQSALFAMSDGSACRVNEFRRIGHPGAVRMNLFGTEGSFEEAVGSQRFLTRDRGPDDSVDLADLLTCRTSPAPGDRGEMAAVTSRDGTHLGAAPIHPVERLPREFAGLPNGHAGSHQFLVDDFVRSCHDGTQPPNHVWNAVAYTVPGIIAHESARRGGELLDIPHLGAPPD